MRTRDDAGRDRGLLWALPWLLAVLVVAALSAGELISRSDTGEGFAPGLPAFMTVVPFVLAVAYVVVGGLIVRAHRRHALGWLLAWFGIAFATGVVVDAYAFHEPALPGREWVALWGGVGYLLGVLPLVTLVPLLFPEGRLPSRRWRLPLALAAGGLLLVVVGNLLSPQLLQADGLPGFDNPIGIDALAPWVGVITGTGMVPIVALAIGGLANLVWRFRGATGVARLQMRWFALGATSTFIGAVGLAVTYELGHVELALTIFALGALMLPLTIGVAILRYRLYEIDRIISRTVSYGVVTVVLVGVYLAGVIGLGAAARGLTGGGGGDLVVAASTLLVAAAFGPVRRRVQTLVDHRFNRARYDVAREVEIFGGRMRDEVDLDALARDLITSVRGTVQPVHASLWFAAPGSRP